MADWLGVDVAQSICSIDGCGKIAAARGWCSKHYTRWHRYGDPTARAAGEVRDGKRVCPRCKIDVPIEGYSPGAAYCRACVAARKRASPPRPYLEQAQLFCVECGTRFMPLKRSMICCSSTCSLSRKRRFDREDAMLRPRDEANAATRRWYEANKDVSYRSKSAYRARKTAAVIEDVDRNVVFERDGWTCQLCGEPVDRDAKAPSPLSVSLDHRVPLSRGGAHSYENCQTSHLLCNVRKGARATP